MSARPYRSRKNRRLALIVGGLAFLGIAVALVLTAFQDSVVFFFSPTDLAAKEIGPDRRVRVGGLVKEGSVTRGPGDGEIHFLVTDGNSTLPIRYVGVLPDLSARARAWSPRAGSPAAPSRPTRCWPSTTRTTCRPRSPTR